MAGGGQSSSESQTDSVQGLSREGKKAFEPTVIATAQRANALALDYAQSPFGFYQGQSGAQMAGTDPNTGLPTGATQWMTPFANQELAKFSAGGSYRGQNSPENTANIVGGTLQGMAGQLIPLATDWQKYTTGLPESVMNSRLGFLNSATQGNTGLLGGQSSGTSSASSWNASLGSSSSSGNAADAKAAAALFGCWIAGVLYGEGSPEQASIRSWLTHQTHPFWVTVRTVYWKYGKRIAQYMQSHPWSQRLLRKPFNYMLRRSYGL